MGTPILPLEWDLFLRRLGQVPNVAAACRDAGIKPSTAYARREADPDFRREWDEAIDHSIGLLEAEAHQRAGPGYLKAVYHQGAVVGHERVVSDGLMQFLLKAHRPERYRERSSVDLNASVVTERMTRAEKDEAIRQIVLKAQARKDEHDLG